MFGWFRKKGWNKVVVDLKEDGSPASNAASYLMSKELPTLAGALLIVDQLMRDSSDPELKKVLGSVVDTWQAGEVEQLKHRLRFTDAVIRSGDVATLAADEKEIMDIVMEVVGKADIAARKMLEIAKKSGGISASELARHESFAELCEKRATVLRRLIARLDGKAVQK